MHHDTIAKNITETGIDVRRMRILGGDLFEYVDGTYDYILTNPPYIDPARSERIEESVWKYEPHAALMGSAGGRVVIDRIISEGFNYLNKDGTLYIEHEPEQTKDISERAAERGFRSITTFRDQYDLERVTRMLHKTDSSVA